MNFLAPLLLMGLGTIAVPIFVHLIQRERKRVVEFPSLMFVQKIPYQSVQRRRLRHWFLLLMRAAAIALIVAAFARPFFPEGAAASLAAAGGSRELVLLLDQSASMGYGDRWQRALAAAQRAIESLGAGDRATLVTFGRNAEERIRATADRGRLEATLNTTTLTSGGTRYGPALKLAESVLSQSNLPRREAVLISDFQKSGWTGSEDVHFGEGTTLTPVVIGDDKPANVAVPSVSFARAPFQNQERITVTAGVTSRSAEPIQGVPVSLEIDGHVLETQTVNIPANAAASVTFAPFTLASPGTHGVVKAGNDAMPVDNTFDFVLNPSQSLSVLVVDSGSAAESSFFLAKALGIGNSPTFQVEIVPAARVTPQTLERRSVVVLNDTPLPPGVGTSALKTYVERGGGLLIAFGDHSTWPQNDVELLPGKLGGPIDRTDVGRGATIGLRDYSHPVFEVFKAPRSGDFSAPRIFRYRSIEPAPTDRVLARYDDGAVAAVERRIGTGRVIAWTTTLDDEWTDLALKPVYLPLVHQFTRYLGQYEQSSAWSTVGQVVDMAALFKNKVGRVVVTPAGERRSMRAEEQVLELSEHGVYELRGSTDASARPERVAVNIEPAESDLTPLDPGELVAAVTGRAAAAVTGTAAAPPTLTPEEAEKHQNLWWYLLVAGLVLLIAENVVANRLSATGERFT